MSGGGFAASLDRHLPGSKVVSYAEAGRGSLMSMKNFIMKKTELLRELGIRPRHPFRADRKFVVWEFPLRDMRAFHGEMEWVSSADAPLVREDASKVVWNTENPNGLEVVGGRPFFWVDNRTAKVHVEMLEPGVLLLQWYAYMGQSLEGVDSRRIRLETDTGFTRDLEMKRGPVSVAVPAPSTRMTISIRALDEPNVHSLPNNDTRVLLAGFGDLKVELVKADEALAYLMDIRHENGVEIYEGGNFLWMNNQPAVMHIHRSTAGRVEFSADVQIGPSLSPASRARLAIGVNGQPEEEREIVNGVFRVEIDLKEGVNQVAMRVIDEATVSALPNGDRRTLLVGMKNWSLKALP